MVHFIWHVMTKRLFFTSSDQSRYTLWSCQNVCDALSYLLNNIYIRFGSKLYRQIVGIPMGTNCAPLVADLFFYTATKEISVILLTMIIKLMLSRLLICNHVTDFNARNKCLTAKLLQQGYRYHKLRKTFSKFYRRHYELISKYNVGLKTHLSEGLSETEFYGDLVYKFKKLKGINDFSFQFRKIITRYRRIGYNLNVMRQSACLDFNPIMVDNYAAFFGWVGRQTL